MGPFWFDFLGFGGFRGKGVSGLTKYVILGIFLMIQLVRSQVGSEIARKSLFLGAGLVYFGRFSGGSFFRARLFFWITRCCWFFHGVMRFPII